MLRDDSGQLWTATILSVVCFFPFYVNPGKTITLRDPLSWEKVALGKSSNELPGPSPVLPSLHHSGSNSQLLIDLLTFTVIEASAALLPTQHTESLPPYRGRGRITEMWSHSTYLSCKLPKHVPEVFIHIIFWDFLLRRNKPRGTG